MAAILSMIGRSGQTLRRRWWIAPILAVPVLLLLASWWLTAPLADSPGPAPDPIVVRKGNPPEPPAAERPRWPDSRLEGDDAKRALLDIIVDAGRRIDRVETYTATFKKRERIDGKLLPEQTLAMKVRQRPLAIYFKFLDPKPGKEVLYAEGHHDNKVLAHNGDWTRRLVPRLAVEPTSSIALADSRHPITEAGLSNLARKLVEFRKLDLEDTDAVTILDRTTGPDGRPWLRSIHLHTHQGARRPYTRVEVLYDPATNFPLQITSYDWPRPGHEGDLSLAEHYAYENLVLDPPLTPLDFDAANPSYEFQRY